VNRDRTLDLGCLQEVLDPDNAEESNAAQRQRRKTASKLCSDDENSDGPPAPPVAAGALLADSCLKLGSPCLYQSPAEVSRFRQQMQSCTLY
jgi:hypothetical protein